MEPSSQDSGFEDSRFENTVNPNFHCPICLNVLKDPKMCRSNEHVFCTPCITRHLANSSTCPQCMEDLTVETLTRPSRFMMNCLSELNINCDYFSRGCRDSVQLGNLQTHVMNCGFAPVQCSNHGCSVEVNKRDRVHHETEVCEFRKVKCHDCGEIRKEIDEIKTNLASMKVQLDRLPSLKEDIIKEVRDIMSEVTNELKSVKKAVQTPVHVKPNTKQDIVIAGSYKSDGEPSCSSEKFCWECRTWTPFVPLKDSLSAATSFIYRNQIIICGGQASIGSTDCMNTIKIDEKYLQWHTFPAKLPTKLFGHKTVVYQNRLIVTGGYNGTDFKYSDAIHEVLLVPPYSTKLLFRMEEPRQYHGTELINDKILILGGKVNGKNEGALDSVILYDIFNNYYKQMPPLPYPLWGMSTVSWGSKVIVIGGTDQNDNILNHVVMYDTETGENKMLPSMTYKRSGCSAVVTGNNIVVMGGWNKEHEYLNSAECFSFISNSWQELPPMIERRMWATAVVKCVNFD